MPSPSPSQRASTPDTERARLAKVRAYRILDSGPEEEFERLGRLARGVLGAPIAMITLVDVARLWFKVRQGLRVTEAERDGGFADAVVASDAPVIVPDVHLDPRFATHPWVVDAPWVRSYVGTPLRSPDGLVLGSLCVFDVHPRRPPSEAAFAQLRDLADAVVDAFEQRTQRHALDEATRRTQLLGDILEATPDLVWYATPDGTLLYANAAARAMAGLASDGDLRGMDTLDDWHPERVVRSLEDVAIPTAIHRGSWRGRTAVLNADGDEVPVSQVILAHRDDEGVLLYLSMVARDASEEVRRERIDERRRHVLERISRHAPLTEALDQVARLFEETNPGTMACILLRRGGRLVPGAAPSLPPGFARLLDGLPIGEGQASCGTAVSRDAAVLVRDTLSDPLWEGLREEVRRFGLRACWSLPVRDDAGNGLGTLAVYRREPGGPSAETWATLEDTAHLAAIAISRQRLVAELEHQAFHDPLTGLPNRTLLRDRLDRQILRAKRDGHRIAVMLVDLDDFKLINDSLGHSAGDRLLREVAARLASVVRAEDTVARLGGDEFVVVMRRAGEDHHDVAVERVMSALTEPFTLAGRSRTVTPSIGIGRYPDDGRDPEELLRVADSAMYAAKADGKRSFRYYRREMGAEAAQRLELGDDLRAALAGEGLSLYYQARVSCEGWLQGLEALVRWQHPHRGLLTPGTFLPVAEASGQLVDLDAWVAERVVRDLGALQRAGHRVRLSCNLAAPSFADRRLAEALVRVIDRQGVDPSGLELEITEGMLMRDLGGVAKRLDELRARMPGVSLAIDDFGTGYSSLTYLRHLPIDTLKIDQSFVADLDHADPWQRRSALAVVRTLVSLGHDLGFRLVAEGVERADQLATLAELGCDEIQGWVFHRAEPLERVMPRLESGELLPRV